MTTAEKFAKYVLPTYAQFAVAPVRGQGTLLWDAEGNRYLDFCSGLATCTLGHGNNALSKAVAKQATELIHCSNLYQINKQAELAECLVEECLQLPGKVFFGNSGAESNDGLIKLARRFGHARPDQNGNARYEVLTFKSSFHGRTLGSLAATGQAKVQEGFDPLLPGFRHLEFNDPDELAAAIRPETAALLLEPIQGEGGIRLAERDFLLAIERVCKEHDLLLLLDEIQCGLGRVGGMTCWRRIAPELKPDGVSWAKALGGGFPIGSFWVSERTIDDDATPLFSVLGPGSHGSTYGGNPLACAAALAVLREVLDNDLPHRALDLEAHIRQEISSWNHPGITEVRGMGLLLGIGLRATNLNIPDGVLPSLHLSRKLAAAGLLAPPAGGDTIRLLPPLTVSDSEVKEALEIFKAGLDALL
jgi:acetylornithine/N-succinyldiaminopimelate aminotransferase